MPVTRILLIRHAHVDPGPHLCGCFDVGLSRKGRTQVESLTKRANGHHAPAALYTSPLTRARVVASALTRLWRIDARVLTAVREIDCGVMEGMAFSDIERNHPELWARNLAQSDENFGWPGGETYREFRARILEGLSEIAARHEGERIAVVTHAGVVSQVLGTLRHRSAAQWERDRPAPLTATEVVWQSGAPREVLSYNAAEWP